MFKVGTNTKNEHQQLDMEQSIHKAIASAKSLPRALHKPRQVEYILQNYAVLKATENEELAWVTLDPNLYQSMVRYITILEDQLEEATLNRVIETRTKDTEFKSGDDLATDALELLNRNEKIIQEHLHGDNN